MTSYDHRLCQRDRHSLIAGGVARRVYIGINADNSLTPGASHIVGYSVIIGDSR